MSINLVIESTVSMEALGRRLTDAEAGVLEDYADLLVAEAKGIWTGWKYEDRKPNTVGRSRAAWRRSSVNTVDEEATIQVINDARHWRSGKPYAGFVTRAGQVTEEWEEVFATWETRLIPEMQRALAKAVGDTAETDGRARQKPVNRPGQTVGFSLEI